MEKDELSFWLWFLKGNKPGYRRYFDLWLIVHLIVGIVISLYVNIGLTLIANAVLLPLASIFVGLSFAWAGNAQSLMQSEEIEKLSTFKTGGLKEYVFIYQSAILMIMTTLILWALVGIHTFDSLATMPNIFYVKFIAKMLLITLSSITIRECWQVIMGTQWLLLVRKQIRDKLEKS